MEKYEKLRVVGRGAYGTVYLCRRIKDKKLAIIKQIPVEQMTKEERQAALNEVKVLSMLDHPNIVEYYENFLEDKALMIVMEYAEGGTLFEFLQQRANNLNEEDEILRLFTQMLLSLQHVHSRQILHRDLKTQNILLNKRKDVVKLGDFGISKILSSKSKAYTVVGTPCYISPELCEGKPYNQKSDIWALGCVLYELTTLRRAFEAANLPALILKIMRGTFAPIADHYSEDLKQLILSMLHLDPNKRPTINQIMCQPIVINALLNLYTEMGKVPCISRVNRPITTAPTPTRGRVSRTSSQNSNKSALSLIMEAGSSLTAKLIVESSVFCWGGGILTPIKLPLPASDTQVIHVATGRTQKAAVTKNGRLIVWEASTVGTEIKSSASPDQSCPTFIPRFLEGQSAVTIQQVSCGDLFASCLTDRGILMTFGSGANGCLGHGTINDISQAKIVEALLGFEVVLVSCGASHIMAVTNDHEVFAWGRGDNGRLGLTNQESYNSPQLVSIPEPYQACSVYCAVDCSMLITTTKELLCCGSNRYNKLAMDDTDSETHAIQNEDIYSFTKVQSQPLASSSILTVAVGASHAAAITDESCLYTFGSNQFGQLGYDYADDDNPRLPHEVSALTNEKIMTIACGDTYTVAVSQDGKVFSWGKSSRGRLGRGDKDTSIPKLIQIPLEEPFTVTSISCSHGNTLIATKPKPNNSK